MIQIKPQDFAKPSAQAIKDVVNEKYSNKIVPGVGLCLCMWDLLTATEGLIGHGTGLVNVNIEFRMTVFRPFRGEIIYGRIKTSNQEGIIIDLDFTSEVFIPFQNLFENSSFSNAENVWVWNSDGTELFFDKGEPVLFRVEQEEWTDQRPTIVQKDDQGNVIEERGTAWRLIVCPDRRDAIPCNKLIKLQGSMNQAGLGPTLWWGEQEEEGEEGDVEMEGAEE